MLRLTFVSEEVSTIGFCFCYVFLPLSDPVYFPLPRAALLQERNAQCCNGRQNFHRIMAAGNQGQEIRDLRRYIRFVGNQQTAERKRRVDGKCTLWPGWEFNRGTLISTPSVVVLNTMHKAGHEEVRNTLVRCSLTSSTVHACFHCTCMTVFPCRGSNFV